MRTSKAAVPALVLSLTCWVLGADSAAAQCRICNPFMLCVTTPPPGARLCVEGPSICTMMLPCFTGGGRFPDGGEEGLLTVSLFDAEGGKGSAAEGATVETDAGPLAVGEGARGHRGQVRGRIAAAMLAYGRDYHVWFADAGERGFSIQRSEAGGAVHIEVREVIRGVPGAVLATSLLLPQDRLRVPVQVNGVARVLVVQASLVPPGQVVAQQAQLRNALREAGREIGDPARPLLEPRSL